MITVYRIRTSGELAVDPARSKTLVKEHGYEHPVLLDLEDAYLDRLKPGPSHYPAVYLLNGDGIVVWEGGTGRTDFESACEEALKKLLTEHAEAPVSGLAPTDR